MRSYPVSVGQLIALCVVMISFASLVLLKRLRSRKAVSGVKRDRASLIGLALQGAGFAAAAMGDIDVGHGLSPPAAIAATMATLLIGGGAALLFGRSAAALGANWSLVARTSDEHRLIRNGPFATIRHPIYAAMMLLLLSPIVGLGHYWQLAIALPFMLLGTMIRVRIEERMLRERFGSAYDDYARDVSALIPGF